jgi:hypothetical protein
LLNALALNLAKIGEKIEGTKLNINYSLPDEDASVSIGVSSTLSRLSSLR